MKDSYQASSRDMKLRLAKLRIEDGQAQKIRVEKLGRNLKDFNRILHHQDLPYVPKIIATKLISSHHDDLLGGYFSIKKTGELVAREY